LLRCSMLTGRYALRSAYALARFYYSHQYRYVSLRSLGIPPNGPRQAPQPVADLFRDRLPIQVLERVVTSLHPVVERRVPGRRTVHIEHRDHVGRDAATEFVHAVRNQVDEAGHRRPLTLPPVAAHALFLTLGKQVR